MRCLWLTRIDPRPAFNGEMIYSDRMIAAFAAAGAEIAVLCLVNPELRRPDGVAGQDDAERDVLWSVMPGPNRPAWRSLLSPLPNVASRSAVPTFRRKLAEILGAACWDAVVFDSLSVGWALPIVLRAKAERRTAARLVYVSHNHEATTRRQVAQGYRGNPIKRAVLEADARKAGLLERRMVAAADLITGISPADAALYRAESPDRRVIELSPGYGGRRVAQRTITRDTPRRVVMVGSFEWIAKQMNLRAFVEAAVRAFESAGADLVVVGHGGPFLETMRRDFPSIRFTGRVDSVYPYLDGARIAVIPEQHGGGFKLKALDYVFNRLPIAALDHAFEGVPLRSDQSVLAFPDFERLVRGIVAAIDDLPLLNKLQERAFAACTDRFEWPSRGRTLLGAVGTP